jgi:hypothetical protein
VDIDAQAVEVTKLSLLLKVLEGENDQSLTRQQRLFHDRGKHSRFLGLMKIPGHGRAVEISMARTAQGERAWGKGARRDRSWHQPD